MKSSERFGTQRGTAYVVIREEKRADELGDNVPSLVPYDCSSEEEDEKDETFDNSQQSDGDSDLEEYNKIPYSSSGSEDDDYFPRRRRSHKSSKPLEFSVQTSLENGCDSVYIDILKDNNCSETCFVQCLDIILPGWFDAKLLEEQAEKLRGDKRVLNVYPIEYFEECEC